MFVRVRVCMRDGRASKQAFTCRRWNGMYYIIKQTRHNTYLLKLAMPAFGTAEEEEEDGGGCGGLSSVLTGAGLGCCCCCCSIWGAI